MRVLPGVRNQARVSGVERASTVGSNRAARHRV